MTLLPQSKEIWTLALLLWFEKWACQCQCQGDTCAICSCVVVCFNINMKLELCKLCRGTALHWNTQKSLFGTLESCGNGAGIFCVQPPCNDFGMFLTRIPISPRNEIRFFIRKMLKSLQGGCWCMFSAVEKQGDQILWWIACGRIALVLCHPKAAVPVEGVTCTIWRVHSQ